MTAPSQLAQLAAPFPREFVEANQGSGGKPYVKHHVVNQWLLGILGPFDFQLVEIIRGDLPAVPPNRDGSSKRAKDGTPELRGAIVGVVCRLTVVIDGAAVVVEEAGDCEDPHNWAHDGSRLKDAMSDALKRCAMRLGLGLHLRADTPAAYVLHGRLMRGQDQQPGTAPLANPDDRPGDPTPGGVANGEGRHPTGTTAEPEVTVADLKALCDRKGTHLGKLLADVRKAARNGEGGFPRAWGADGRKGLQSFDQLAPDALAKVRDWAFPELVEAPDDLRDLVDPEGAAAP